MAVDSLIAVLNQVVDGGSTYDLNADIQLSTSQQALDLRDELIQKSPYLSDTVMKSAIEKESVLPNEMIRDIMVANPQTTQSDHVLTELDNRFTPMPEYMLDEILQAGNSLSPKEILDAQLQSQILKRQFAFNELVRYYQNDTVNPSSNDSLLALLERERNLDARYRLAFEYLMSQDTVMTNNVLEDIPEKFSLNNGQQQQHEDYLAYFGFLKSLQNQQKSVFQLNNEETMQLQWLKTNTTDPVKTYCQNILEANEVLLFHEQVLMPDNLKSVEINRRDRLKPTFEEQYIKVFPNPARDFVILDYDLKRNLEKGEQLEICIAGLNGVQKELKITRKSRDQVLIKTNAYQTGLYICTISIGHNKIGSTEFAIIY